MSHFPVDAWIDLVRGVLAPSEANPLEGHLSQECPECLNSLSIWRLVSELAKKEAGFEPPAIAVMAAKQAYVPRETADWLRKATDYGRLVFDSFRQPQVATVRSSTKPGRQLSYESTPFTIDMRLEPVQNRISLIGQVLDALHPDRPAVGVQVVLLSGDRVLRKAAANAEGEFELNFEDGPDLRLFIDIHGERGIGIVLPVTNT